MLDFGVLAEKFSPNSDTFQPIAVVRPTDALPLPSESQPLEHSGRFPESQLNNLACGGARLSGKRTGYLCQLIIEMYYGSPIFLNDSFGHIDEVARLNLKVSFPVS